MKFVPVFGQSDHDPRPKGLGFLFVLPPVLPHGIIYGNAGRILPRTTTICGNQHRSSAPGRTKRNPMKTYEYDAIIHVDPESGGAYVAFPWDLRAESGKGRLRVHAEFDGIPYDGSIVNMGVKNEDGSVCYVIGVLKAIRNRLGKGDGNSIHVVITAAGGEKP